MNTQSEEISWEKVLKRTTARTILNSDSKQKPQYDLAASEIEENAVPGMVILPGQN